MCVCVCVWGGGGGRGTTFMEVGVGRGWSNFLDKIYSHILVRYMGKKSTINLYLKKKVSCRFMCM